MECNYLPRYDHDILEASSHILARTHKLGTIGVAKTGERAIVDESLAAGACRAVRPRARATNAVATDRQSRTDVMSY